MIVADETASHCVDAVVADGVVAARANGVGEPNVQEIRSFVQGIVESADRHRTEDKPALPSKPKRGTTDVERLIWEANRHGRKLDASEWNVWRGGNAAEPPPVVDRGELYKLLQARIRLMCTKPEYLKEIRAVAIDSLGGLGKERKAKAMRKLYELVEKSNKHWGDWWKPKPKTLVFG